MELGDFTKLAKDYINRTGYSETVLRVILSYIEKCGGAVNAAADVGAGTGKLTENLEAIGLRGYAVEPNEAMRAEGVKLFRGRDSFVWSEGFAEETHLPENCVDWVLMGSSFHWADASAALKEFHRILRPGGFFTAIWNPRNLESSPFHMEIEAEIQRMVPQLNQVSSRSRKNMQGTENKLLSTEYFIAIIRNNDNSSAEIDNTSLRLPPRRAPARLRRHPCAALPLPASFAAIISEDCYSDLFLVEGPHQIVMNKERYMGAWRSVNDIQAQAGEERFHEILDMIEDKINGLNEIVVPYLSRAFTVRSTKR